VRWHLEGFAENNVLLVEVFREAARCRNDYIRNFRQTDALCFERRAVIDLRVGERDEMDEIDEIESCIRLGDMWEE